MAKNIHDLGGSPPASPSTRAKRWRWLSGGLLLLLFSPILVTVIWYLCVRISNSKAVARLEMEIRQRGEPLTLTELQAIYEPVPDDANAAVALLALWEQEEPEFWTAFRLGTRPLPQRSDKKVDPALPVFGSGTARIDRSTPLDAKTLALAKDYLAREAGHLAAAHAALQRPKARFPLDLTNGFACLLPQLASMKHEAQIFRLAALVATDQAESDAAISALRDSARAGQILADDPFLISQLVRISCLAVALGGVEHLMSRQSLALAQLEQLKSALDDMNTRGGLKQGLLGERAMGLSVFKMDARTAAAMMDNPNGGEDSGYSSSGFRAGIIGMKLVGLAAADQRLLLETFKDAVASSEKESPETLTQMEQIFQRASTEARRFPPKIFSGMLLPALGRTEAKFAALEARRRAAQVAVAIEQYRLQQAGKLPEKLEHLVPQFLSSVPTDPFDGQPIRYKTLEKGYVVYSIGADKTDDGGKERKPGKGGSQNIDDTFIVER